MFFQKLFQLFTHKSKKKVQKPKNMLKENFISQAPDEESNAKVTPLDNNKTIIIDQYTSDVEVGNSELFEAPKTMQDVFAHFKPTVDVEFEDEMGGIVSEKLHFNEMRDFEANGGKGNLVANSPFLSGAKSKVDVAAKIRKQIEQNRRLRDILKDEEGKAELKELLEALLQEIKEQK